MRIAQDKLEHMLGGFAIAVQLISLQLAWAVPPAVLAVAIIKEIIDSRGYGTPEPMDVLATALGGALPLGAYSLAPEVTILLSRLSAIALIAFYLMWVIYIACMNLKRVRNAGLLSPQARALGLPLLVVGYLLDFALNVGPMTLILVELPRETTVSERLARHNRESTGWRLAVVRWFEPVLDPFDPSGDHI